MDFQEIRETKLKAQQAIEEEKMRVGLTRQMRILNKEKEVYAHKTNNYINKIQITLGFLQNEKSTELENYLATQSESVEKNYAREEAIVRRLVKTTRIVKQLLAEEEEANKKLNKQILKVKAEAFATRKSTMLDSLERNKFRVPSQQKMDSRVEQANKRYHIQHMRNTELKEKIDNALITRGILFKEEAKMEKELSSLYDKILQVMADASQCYEERDRNEGTRLKLLEHLTKVKESCVKELQGLTSSLNEDKEMETFMRIKQKDKGGYIRDKRAMGKKKIKEMLKKRDEYCLIFDRIKEAIGIDDIEQIVQNFITTEGNNFTLFKSIGDQMDELLALRHTSRELRAENVAMELQDLNSTQNKEDEMRAIRLRIENLKQKQNECEQQMKDDDAVLQEVYNKVNDFIQILGMDHSNIKSYKSGVLSSHNVIAVLTDVEAELANVLKDFTMVELATRATMFNKTELTEDQMMLMRRPSMHVKPAFSPRFNPLSVHKHTHDADNIPDTKPLTFEEAKYILSQAMINDGRKVSRRIFSRTNYGKNRGGSQFQFPVRPGKGKELGRL